MFDTPSDLIKHNQRISSLPHKDAGTDDLISEDEMYGFADYHLARAAAGMLLDHGIDHHVFMRAMQHEIRYRAGLDED